MAIKTLHLTNLYNSNSGGIATFYRAMMRRAVETGRELVLIVPGESNRVQQVGPTVRMYTVEAGHSLIGDRRYRVLLPHHFLFPGDTRFKQILRLERPQLVEACDKYSLMYLLGYYRLGWIDGSRGPATVALTMERMDDNFGTYLNASPAAMRFCRWFMQQIYFRIPKYHIAISDYVADEIQQSPWARKLDKTRVLPLGVDALTFQPPADTASARDALRRQLGLSAGSRVLLYAGRLSLEKNIPLLVAMLEVLIREGDADLHLALVGSGMMRQELESKARGPLRGRLHLLPHVQDRKELARVLSGADVFVHPNPREPFGIGPLEAMACGLPVVLPNRGGVLEYATPENSWPAEPNPDAFARAVRDALEREEPRQGKTASARKTAEKQDWSLVTDRYFAQYEAFYADFLTNVDPWPIPFRPTWWPTFGGLGKRPTAGQGETPAT